MKKQHLTQGKNKGQQGITLIALIITIIVLLILAAVTIRAVTGGNGILAHAKNARDKWEEAADEEEAMLGNLTNYITEQGGSSGNSGGETSKDTGPLLDALNPEDYGKKVNFKSKGAGLEGLVWRIFYKDSKNVYLISEKGEEHNKDYPVSSFTLSSKMSEYKDGRDVSEQGQDLMPKAKEAGNVFVERNTKDNIKGTAYLCDITKWEDYTDAEKKAAWAMGAPTIELFTNSYNAVKSNGNTIELSIKDKGYTQNTNNNWFTTEMKSGIYRLKSSGLWWLASPSGSPSSFSSNVLFVNDDGGSFDDNYVYASRCARPVVCIPVSNFNGFTVEGN